MRINLVMSGGGTRLPAYVGAIMALHELGAQVVRVAGVSGGAVVGAFLAAGFDTAKLHSLAVDTDYRQFIDISARAIVTGNGLCTGKRFERWMDEHLGGARFGELPLDLRVVATDILAHRPVIFSRATTPDVRVAEAVRYSMGIPGYFVPRRWRGHVLVDGVLVPHALWTIFDDAEAVEARTAYVLLASQTRQVGSTRRILWPWDYGLRVVRMLILALENARVPAHLWKDTAVIKTGEFGAVDFGMTRAQKVALVQDAYLQVKTYLMAKSSLFPPPPSTNDDSRGGGGPHRYLAVVQPERPDVYRALLRHFESNGADLAEVIWDRRREERRQPRNAPVPSERRRAQRRGSPPDSWTLGFALVYRVVARE